MLRMASTMIKYVAIVALVSLGIAAALLAIYIGQHGVRIR